MSDTFVRDMIDAQRAKLIEQALPASEVRYDLRKPCDDCPFKKSTPFHQGVAESLPLYLEMIEEKNFAHTCHKTDTRPSVDGPRDHEGPIQHCAGALIMLCKGDDWMQAPLVQAVLDHRLDLGRLAKAAARDKQCFTLREMKRFYIAEIGKRAGIKRRKRGKNGSGVTKGRSRQKGDTGTGDLQRTGNAGEPPHPAHEAGEA